MNFMYNVMQNGIGGVNCGGIENDVVIGKAQDLAIADAKVYQYLTRDKKKAEIYAEQGFLDSKSEVRTNKNGRRYTYTSYKVTPLGFQTYLGKAVLDYKEKKDD